MLQAPVLDPETGAIDIIYTTTCNAYDYSIVYGDLADVGSLPGGYDGAICSIGDSGVYLGFDPATLPSPPSGESYFFLIVAHGVVGPDLNGIPVTAEGSYGLSETGERPPSFLCGWDSTGSSFSYCP